MCEVKGFKMASSLPAIFCLVMAALVTGQIDVQPREAVIVKGGNVSMVCKVAYPIDSCRVRVASVTYSMKPNPRDQTANLQYYGHGLDMGECGVVIHRVDESMNGNITCSIPSQTSPAEIEGVMRLIIAKEPGQPTLTLSPGSISQNMFRAGDRMQARCDVPHGRPPAKLYWYLGDNQLLDGLHQVAILDEPNSDLKTISQNLTRIVLADDDGKTLICKAEHEALNTPYRAQRQLDVQYPPQRLEAGQITIFGVKLREDGLLNVTVRANPPPAARWSIGDIRLNTGEVDHEDKYEARHIQPLGNGFYLVSLLIRNVEKLDVERTYLLTVKNVHGSEDFAVRISTSEEPEAVQLDTGSIVGIVVAVLVVLIAVFLVIFARATNRWCFADQGGAGESRPRSSGESHGLASDVLLQTREAPAQSQVYRASDTESAVGGPKAERRRLPDLSRALPALRSVLPGQGRKDKVVAEPQPEAKPADEEKPLQEGEKKSIVYAELALVPPAAPAPAKPNPEATEYAEIVYGNPPQQEQPKKD